MLEKYIYQPLTGRDISFAKWKSVHLIKLKLVDKKNHNKSLSVDILIGSYYIWNIFENKINRVESWTPIAMETVGVCYIMVSCQTSEFSKL